MQQIHKNTFFFQKADVHSEDCLGFLSWGVQPKKRISAKTGCWCWSLKQTRDWMTSSGKKGNQQELSELKANIMSQSALYCSWTLHSYLNKPTEARKEEIFATIVAAQECISWHFPSSF